jgi:hypothetical protein
MSKGGWSRAFDDPIVLPKGRKLVTLRDAAEYIVVLPPLVQKMPQWQTAVAALMMVAATEGPTMMARIAMMQALNVGKPEPRGTRAKAYKIVR